MKIELVPEPKIKNDAIQKIKFNKKSNYFEAWIKARTSKEEPIYLGEFKTENEASKAWLKAYNEYVVPNRNRIVFRKNGIVKFRIYSKHGELTTSISEKDYERVNQYRWCARVHSGNTYIVTQINVQVVNNKGKVINTYQKTCTLNQFIMKNYASRSTNNLVSDHIDNDRLNNIRENLRKITHAENVHRGIKKEDTSKNKEIPPKNIKITQSNNIKNYYIITLSYKDKDSETHIYTKDKALKYYNKFIEKYFDGKNKLRKLP